MSSETRPSDSQKARSFLLAFRWIALTIGLVLTSAHGSNPFLFPRFPPEIPTAAVTAFIIVFELVMTIYAWRFAESGAARAGVVILDVLVGAFLCFGFGASYFFLACTLPVLEATLLWGGFAGGLTLLFTAMTPIARQLVFSFRLGDIKPPEGVDYQTFYTNTVVPGIWSVGVHESAVMVAATIAMMAFVAILRSSGDQVERDVREYKELQFRLQEEIDSLRKDSGQFASLAEQRRSEADELKQQLEDAQGELEDVQKRLHQATHQIQGLQQMAQKKEQQLTQVHRREQEDLKAELDQMHHLLDRVTHLVEISRDLHQSIRIDETFLAVLSGALRLVPSQTGILFVLDDTQSPPELFPEAAAGPYQSFFAHYSFKLGEQVPGWVAQHVEPVKIDNESVQHGSEVLSSLVTYEKSVLAVPLSHQDRPLGVLYVGRPEPNGYTEEELEDVMEFGRQASRAIHNSAEYQKAVAHGITDPVTHLHNQLYFFERLKEEGKRSNRYRYSVALMLLDVDHFAQFNEGFGHDAGNQLLRELGEIIRDHTRETDVISREKNDEFAVLLVQSNKNAAILIGDRIRGALQMRYLGRNSRSGGALISVSIGIASMPEDCKDPDELYQLGKMALAAAKNKGGNSVAWPPDPPSAA